VNKGVDLKDTEGMKQGGALSEIGSGGGIMSAFTPKTYEQAINMAMVMSRAGDMIPKCYRGSPGAVLLSLQTGAELGLSPMQALQAIAPINGRATLWGDALPAIVQRAGHKITEWIEGDGEQMVAYCKLVRGDNGHETIQSFSVEDAKRAGLWNKEGPWQKYPKRMLQMRARGFCVRDGAADALAGLRVREEELDQQVAEAARDVTPRQTASDLVALKQAANEDPGADVEIEDIPKKEEPKAKAKKGKADTEGAEDVAPEETPSEHEAPKIDMTDEWVIKGYESRGVNDPRKVTVSDESKAERWYQGWDLRDAEIKADEAGE